MKLTNKQEEGLRIAVARYRAREPWTCISGYAGSGKTTLVSFIIAALGLCPEDVAYIAFTGKAATVLKQKGCPNAVTAHKLLYWASPTPTGKYVYKPRTSLEEPYKLLVIDEVSMLPKPMWDRLLTHKIPVIALGDPGQLPPINPEDDNHVLDNPHVFLDEIMRQAQDSEIIRLATHVRSGEPISSFEASGAQVKIFKKSELTTGMLTWADQVICATNETRTNVNNIVRKLKGYGELPCQDDKLISLNNHWEYYSANGDWALTNGSIGNLGYFYTDWYYPPRYIKQGGIEYMYADIHLDNGDKFNMVPIDYKCLLTGEPCLTGPERYKLNKNNQCPDAQFEFAYAYAITCWKAQGSEYDNVLGIEERHPFEKDLHQKYLYTLITRAKNRLVLITKE